MILLKTIPNILKLSILIWILSISMQTKASRSSLSLIGSKTERPHRYLPRKRLKSDHRNRSKKFSLLTWSLSSGSATSSSSPKSRSKDGKQIKLEESNLATSSSMRRFRKRKFYPRRKPYDEKKVGKRKLPSKLTAPPRPQPPPTPSSLPSAPASNLYYPHQYTMQIRWGKPGQKVDNLRKDLDERTRYRKFAHEEEEHWHDRKWINIGGQNELDDGRRRKKSNGNRSIYELKKRKFQTLPVFARPLKDEASLRSIRKHFAIPSPSFPVNKHFTDWASRPVQFTHYRDHHLRNH